MRACRSCPAATSTPCTTSRRLYSIASPESAVILPFASCTIKFAAARSQSRLWPPAKAASRLPSATRHSRSASDPIRGCSVISSGDGLSRCTSGFGPAMREKSSSLPAAARTGLSLRVVPWPRIAKKNSSRGGREHRRQHRRRACDQRHAHAPVFAAGEIGAGAVDRVDDPDQFLAETAVVVDALFRQPAIIRRRRAQPPLDEVVDGDVGLGDRRRGALGPVLQLGAKQRQGQRAGLAHGVPQQRGIARPDPVGDISVRQASGPRCAASAR